MDSISRFYSTVIHEMRSPLSIIRGALEWIERRPGDPASNARDMDTAKRGVKRVDDILTRLNVFAIGGASSNRISPIELNFPIQDAIQMARFEAQKNGISLSITGTVSSLVLGNPWELMHVFWSLIENSIQAIQHCEDRWVTIDLLNRDGAVVVRIRDSGRGIPAGDMDRIFEPYFSTKPDNSGLGFGLSVAKKVLAKCGAKICYRPDEKNTCFELIFPVVKATEITVRLA